MQVVRKLGVDPVVFCVFDALVVRGRSIMDRPLAERKKALAKLLSELPNILVVGYIVGDGVALYRDAVTLQLEGLVAKRLDS